MLASGCTTDGGSLKSSSAWVRCASFLGDAYAGGGECESVPMDSFATWKAREGAFRAISCFSDSTEPVLEEDELSDMTETAGTGAGGV